MNARPVLIKGRCLFAALGNALDFVGDDFIVIKEGRYVERRFYRGGVKGAVAHSWKVSPLIRILTSQFNGLLALHFLQCLLVTKPGNLLMLNSH